MQQNVEIFFCYAREDESSRQGLEKQLTALKRQGLVTFWHDRNITAGTEWQREIDQHLNTADIILLLVSPDFMNSDYCYGIEMKRAMERHERGETSVIPVIVRPVYWQDAPFGKLQALPTDSKPIQGSGWHNQDEAFFDVAEGIRTIVEQKRASISTPFSSTRNTTPVQEEEKAPHPAVPLPKGIPSLHLPHPPAPFRPVLSKGTKTSSGSRFHHLTLKYRVLLMILILFLVSGGSYASYSVVKGIQMQTMIQASIDAYNKNVVNCGCQVGGIPV
jgi:hypothetical protein